MAIDFRRRYRVTPGQPARIRRRSTAEHGRYASEEDAAGDLAKAKTRLNALQKLLYADRSKALLVVLQGMDASGKDGTCAHVIGAMDPIGVHIVSFKMPTPEEAAHDFLWRVHRHVPAQGEVAVFNRSHYEEVVAARVRHLVPKDAWRARFARINAFEELLATDGRTTVLKFFLHISKDEQLSRFKARLDDPSDHWKISESDYTDRALWDAYEEAYEDALTECSTRIAPWYVVPADRKWFRNLAISTIIADAMDDMDLTEPAASVDLEDIRRRYFAEAMTTARQRKAGGKKAGA